MKEKKVQRFGGDNGSFLRLLFGCFLTSVLVCGCYCFTCTLGQLILPLINTLLSPWISARKASAGIFIYRFLSSAMCEAGKQGGNEI